MELYRRRIDATRELVLEDDGMWWCHDGGPKPKEWDRATNDEMEMAREIARLQAER